MTNQDFQDLIVSSNNDARVLGLTGTPAFFVIDKDNQVQKISGAQPFEVFEQIFEDKLKN